MKKLLVTVLLALAPSLAFAQPKIIIDPGHGGTDPGGTGQGAQEKTIVLDVSNRFKALLDADTADNGGGGTWVARLTRTDDTFVSLAARSQYSNSQGADRFMSMHSNAVGDASANGTETFSFAATGTGAQLRNLVQAEMIDAWQLTNRGNKTANFAVLRDTAAPAELHELAFITNATDSVKLKSATERQKAAVAHLRAIQRHFNIAPYLPGTEPVPETGQVTGFVVDDRGPIAAATVTVDTGESTTTDADGAFMFAGVAAGGRTLSARSDDHDPGSVEITVAIGATAETEIELVRKVRIGEEEEEPAASTGGCSTSSQSGAFALSLVLFVVSRRRRSR